MKSFFNHRWLCTFAAMSQNEIRNALQQNRRRQLIVIGGGAAGFFCAVNAARMNPSLKVIIAEKTSKLLSKVRVSGGGRCNVSHACFEISALVKKYPRGTNFLKKAFYQFNTNHCVQWFEERGVKLKTETDGRMFPITDNSQTIIDCLLREANKYGVEIMLNSEVRSMKYDEKFVLELSDLIPHTSYLTLQTSGILLPTLYVLPAVVILKVPCLNG